MKPALLLILRLVALLGLVAASAAVGPCDPEPLGDIAADDGGAVAPRPDAGVRLDTGQPTASLGSCAAITDFNVCSEAAGCRWLAPGCGDQRTALARPGCFSTAEINCTSDASCLGGRKCLDQNIDPCYVPPERMQPGTATCAACGQLIKLCL
jgi:hypothetical protein